MTRDGSSGSGATNKWLVTISVMTGTIMSVLDVSIVNVALPHMQGSLGASVESITWVATGYILSEGFMMPLVSLLSSRIGRKRYYQFSVMVFASASMLCGLATSLPMLVAFRILQGFGGGALIPLSQTFLLENFPPRERGTAMGIFGVGVVFAPAFGPTVGGWLTDHYSWPWIFFINVPIGILNLMLVQRFVEEPEHVERQSGGIDWTGLALLAIGLSCLQIMLEKGERNQWFQSDLIRGLALAALLGLALFIWWELRTKRPAVNLRILKNVPFTSATLIGGVLGVGLYASIFVLPLFLQNLLGYPAFNSGLTLMPRSLTMGLVFPIAGRLYNKLGPRVLIASGLGLGAYSFWQFSRLSLDVGFDQLLWPQVLQGAGFALIFVALSAAAVIELEKRQLADATGLYNVIRRVFGSAGVALAATQIDRGNTRYYALLVHNVSRFRGAAAAWLHRAADLGLAGTGPGGLSPRGLAVLSGTVARQAAMLAFNHVFYLIAFVFVISLPLVLFLRGGTGEEGTGHMETEHVEAVGE